MTKDTRHLNSNYSANTSKNASIGPESYRTPTDAELWSVFQKWFAFEEPSNKWSQVRKALKKLIRRGPDKIGESLSLQQQGVLFSHIFSSANIKSNTDSQHRNAEKLFSLVLAVEDIKRFNRLAFDTWLSAASASSTACALGGADTNDSDIEAATIAEEPLSISISGYSTGFDISIAGDAVLSQSELLWIENSMNASPGWYLLTNDGPWTGDARAELVKKFLDGMSEHLAASRQTSAFAQPTIDFALSSWKTLVENARKQSADREPTVPDQRGSLPGHFLPAIQLLVEGQTECILLPAMSKLLGVDLNELAVDITDCGGAKQVVKRYLNLKEVTVLPIICVLDSDVEEPAEVISDSLRASDRLITLTHKEIEDTFSEGAFLRLLSIYMAQKADHHTGAPLTLTELQETESQESGRTIVLDRLLRARGMGSFDKIGFARVAAEKLQSAEIPQDGKTIVEALLEIHNDGVKFRYQSN